MMLNSMAEITMGKVLAKIFTVFPEGSQKGKDKPFEKVVFTPSMVIIDCEKPDKEVMKTHKIINILFSFRAVLNAATFFIYYFF